MKQYVVWADAELNAADATDAGVAATVQAALEDGWMELVRFRIEDARFVVLTPLTHSANLDDVWAYCRHIARHGHLTELDYA